MSVISTTRLINVVNQTQVRGVIDPSIDQLLECVGLRVNGTGAFGVTRANIHIAIPGNRADFRWSVLQRKHWQHYTESVSLRRPQTDGYERTDRNGVCFSANR